jgi:hypothetical protein
MPTFENTHLDRVTRHVIVSRHVSGKANNIEGYLLDTTTALDVINTWQFAFLKRLSAYWCFT